jgi:signal transduction histidine kinase
MIRSIYVKNSLSYLLIMIVSLILSFSITSLFFQNKIVKLRETEIMDQGKGMADLYKGLGDKGFRKYLKSMSDLPYDVFLYDRNGLVLKTPNAAIPNGINRKTIKRVMEGDEYQKAEGGRRSTFLYGLPFTAKKEKYALYIKPSFTEQFSLVRNILLTALFIVLLMGISLNLIITRFLLKPLARVTNATKALAAGNFQIRLDVDSKDEIGQLAKSFNFMVAELNKTEQMRKDFVANVSHELQSPLTAIKGMAIALREGAVDPSEEKHYLSLIQQESERLSSLTKQLLSLSLLEANKSPFHPKPYFLDRQIRNQLVAMQALWLEKNLEIDFDLPKIQVNADEALMNQVWTNLFTNAIKYNIPNGKISVNGSVHDDHVEIAIKNTGPGIPQKDIPYIFDRFYRVEKAHTRTTESYGLGLAVVKRIIILHNAKINVESIEGKETTFRIFIEK